jgi:predicted RNA-binding Zn ribbon-like protein
MAIASERLPSMRKLLRHRLERGAGFRLDPRGSVLAALVRLSDSGRLERVKICDSDECRWVFYDRSKPGNRRWCSSDRCGNREKTRTYRNRHRSGAA